MDGFIPVHPLDDTTSGQAKLIGHFQSKYGRKAQFVIKVPGRVNLVGEHVDYSGKNFEKLFNEKGPLVNRLVRTTELTRETLNSI